MKFTIRELLLAVTVFALVAAGMVNSRRHAIAYEDLKLRITRAEDRAKKLERAAVNHHTLVSSLIGNHRAVEQEQRLEILELRDLLKKSIGDQRDWFELQVERNTLVAVRPATTAAVEVTPSTVRQIEAVTGVDGRRLRHYLTPPRQLRPSQPVDVLKEKP